MVLKRNWKDLVLVGNTTLQKSEGLYFRIIIKLANDKSATTKSLNIGLLKIAENLEETLNQLLQSPNIFVQITLYKLRSTKSHFTNHTIPQPSI